MPRSLKLTVFVLLLLSVITAGLGVWQLHRAQEKKQLQKQWQEVENLSVIDLNLWNVSSASSLNLAQGRKVSAYGDLLLQDSLLLSPRTLEDGQGGRLGAWWLAPLQLSSNSDNQVASSVALLVLVGWVADANIPQLPKTPRTQLILHGHAIHNISAYRRLASEQYSDFSKPWLNFDWQNYRSVWQHKQPNLELLPLILQLDTPTGSKVEPIPSLVNVYMTVERHYAYAITWFSFSAIALGVMIVLLWRRYRLSKQRNKRVGVVDWARIR